MSALKKRFDINDTGGQEINGFAFSFTVRRVFCFQFYPTEQRGCNLIASKVRTIQGIVSSNVVSTLYNAWV